MVTALDKQTALVLIDLQKGILSRQTATPIPDILKNIVKLIDAFRKKGLPVIFTNVELRDAAWTKTRKEQNMTQGATPTADMFEIVPEVNK